jgi:hypothetical protein
MERPANKEFMVISFKKLYVILWREELNQYVPSTVSLENKLLHSIKGTFCRAVRIIFRFIAYVGAIFEK